MMYPSKFNILKGEGLRTITENIDRADHELKEVSAFYDDVLFNSNTIKNNMADDINSMYDVAGFQEFHIEGMTEVSNTDRIKNYRDMLRIKKECLCEYRLAATRIRDDYAERLPLKFAIIKELIEISKKIANYKIQYYGTLFLVFRTDTSYQYNEFNYNKKLLMNNYKNIAHQILCNSEDTTRFGIKLFAGDYDELKEINTKIKNRSVFIVAINVVLSFSISIKGKKAKLSSAITKAIQFIIGGAIIAVIGLVINEALGKTIKELFK